MVARIKIHKIHSLWLSIFFCCSTNQVYADQPAPQDIKLNSVQESQLANIEKKLFGHNFPSDSISERLSRMEELVFGDSSDGTSTNRLTKISLAVVAKADRSTQTTGTSTQTDASTQTNSPDDQENFDTAMKNGSVDFEARRFHSAQNHFERAIKLNSRSAKAYAYLGDTLYHLQDRDGARAAYKACFMVDPFGDYSAYAKNYLLKLTNEDTTQNTSPQDIPQTVTRTVALINRQAADAARRYLDRGDVYARYRLNLGNIEIQKINGDTAMLLSDLARGAYGGGGGGYYTGHRYRNYSYNRGDSVEISNMAQIRTNYMRTDSQVQANLYRIEATKKAATVQETAANLKDQMLQPVKPGDAKLRALGTSLYARYYGDGLPSTDDSTPADPLPEALTAAAKEITPDSRKGGGFHDK